MTRSSMPRAARAISLGASALAIAMATPAFADGEPAGIIETPAIVPGGTLGANTSPPAGILDNVVNITGVGQVVTDAGGGFVGTCTGTLINPRTVIFAAHCVNGQAANTYGAATGGKPISVGFQAANLNPLIAWLSGGYQTNVANALYNVEQVWYDPRSLLPGPTQNFLQADIALATLDTPAFGIPTWAMLFSELTGETHVRVNGYGSTGNGNVGSAAGGGFRRRAAENMLSLLASLSERNQVFFGSPASPLIQSLYHLDFDSPAGEASFNPTLGATSGRFDFDIYDGVALPREGTTGPGDSGGPLIVDQRFDREVVVGVLSGGGRVGFNSPTGPVFPPFGSFGTTSFYQPLFLYWDTIVANNSYAYVTAKEGNGNWADPSHWLQTMDPNYVVEVDGQLVNALPGTPGLGVSGDTAKFGKICFLANCVDIAPLSTPGSLGALNSLIVPGGPGSTGFVPNNVRANPGAGIRARYYDVTLGAAGRTTLGEEVAVTIDRLTIKGSAALKINKPGLLTVLGDFTQMSGATQVDGLLKTGEALIVSGALTGTGVIDPVWLTVVAGGILPGGNGTIGTLSVIGNVTLSSGATTLFDLNRNGADLLAVTGDTLNAGIVDLGGTAGFQLSTANILPRANQSFTVVTAAGGITNTFDSVLGGIGILTPTLTYNPNSVVVTLTPGSFATALGAASPTALAFGGALDSARASSYTSLSAVYGRFDVMNIGQLAGAFEGLAPRIASEAALLDQDQGAIVTSLVGDRLAMLGTDASGRGRFTVVGAPQALAAGMQLSRSSAAQLSFANSLTPSAGALGALPEHMSGFVSGGFEQRRAALADVRGGERTSWHMAMGLEMAVSDRATLGTAFGHVDGRSGFIGSQADAATSQAAVYGSYRLGGGAYVGGLASIAHTRLGLERSDGLSANLANLRADTTARAYNVQAEAGVNLGIGRGLTLTPRAGLHYASYTLNGYGEGGGETALRVKDIGIERLEARLGATLSGSMGTAKRGWSFTPELRADFVSALTKGANTFNVSFAAAPDHVFALPFAGSDRSWGEVKGGFRLANGPLGIGAGLESSIGRSDYRDDRAVANVSFAF